MNEEELNYDDLAESFTSAFSDCAKALSDFAEQWKETSGIIARGCALKYSERLIDLFEKSTSTNIFVRWYWKMKFRKMLGGVPEFIKKLKPLLE